MRRVLLLLSLLSLTGLLPPHPALAQVAIPPGQYDDGMGFFLYRGPWELAEDPLFSGGYSLYSTDPAAYMEFWMEGWGISWYRTVGPDRGNIEICFTGAESFCETISNTAPAIAVRQPVTLYFVDYLSGSDTGPFTGRVVVSNTPDNTIDVDQIDVLPNPDWIDPTPWPTPDATPFIDTWEQGAELPLHIINAWRWINASSAYAGGIQIMDALGFGLMLFLIFTIIVSAIRRMVGGARSGATWVSRRVDVYLNNRQIDE